MTQISPEGKGSLEELLLGFLGRGDDDAVVSRLRYLDDASESEWKDMLTEELRPQFARMRRERVRSAGEAAEICSRNSGAAEALFYGSLFPFDPPGEDPATFFRWVHEAVDDFLDQSSEESEMHITGPDVMPEADAPASGPQIDAARFKAHLYQYAAIKIAIRKAKKTRRLFHDVRFPVTIGEGYLKGGNDLKQTRNAIVALQDDLRVRAAHPDLRADARSRDDAVLARTDFEALGELLVPLVGGADDQSQVERYGHVPRDEEDGWLATLISALGESVARLDSQTLSNALDALGKCAAEVKVAEDTRCSLLLPFPWPGDDERFAFRHVKRTVERLVVPRSDGLSEHGFLRERSD